MHWTSDPASVIAAALLAAAIHVLIGRFAIPLLRAAVRAAALLARAATAAAIAYAAMSVATVALTA